MTEPVVEVKTELARHALSKMILGSIAGFATSKLVEKAYDFALTKYRQRSAS